MTSNHKEKLLDEFLGKMKEAAGSNLDAIVVYGSAASPEYQPGVSDLNVLCLLHRLDAAELLRIGSVVNWWRKKGQPQPMIFTITELRGSADVFAIELYDIKHHHRILFGPDHFAALEVPMHLHRLQVERDLKVNLIKLRQSYMAAPRNTRAVLQLLTGSVSSFITLFRHALIALGEQPPQGKREAITRIASLLHFDHAAFDRILDLRAKRITAREIDAVATFNSYLEAISQIADEVDRRLA